jgi:SAM-dependent methyltransferase
MPASPPQTDLAALYALLVAGDDVDRPLPLVPDDLVERRGNALHACLSVLPLGTGLLVCDRLDADGGTDLVCWPDDSSYHLALSISPGRRARWLDVATGSGFAPILRPELAGEIGGTDLNARAIRYARRGLELSGITHATVHEADLTAGVDGTFELVTCNAPIPADVGPLWRATADTSFFARLFAEIPRVLAPDGMALVHGALGAMAPVVESLPGERVVVSYVPPGGRPFGILWWQPGAPARHVAAYRELTVDRPHLTHADRLAALD